MTFSLRNFILTPLNRSEFDLVADDRNKDELAFFGQLAKDRGHGSDDTFNNVRVGVVHVGHDTAGIDISELFVVRLLVLAINGHEINVEIHLLFGVAEFIEFFYFVLGLTSIALRGVREEISVCRKNFFNAFGLTPFRLLQLGVKRSHDDIVLSLMEYLGSDGVS